MIALLTTLQKQTNNFIPNHIGEIKACNFFKNGHILHNENNSVKKLMNAFLNSYWIYKDYTWI